MPVSVTVWHFLVTSIKCDAGFNKVQNLLSPPSNFTLARAAGISEYSTDYYDQNIRILRGSFRDWAAIRTGSGTRAPTESQRGYRYDTIPRKTLLYLNNTRASKQYKVLSLSTDQELIFQGKKRKKSAAYTAPRLAQTLVSDSIITFYSIA